MCVYVCVCACRAGFTSLWALGQTSSVGPPPPTFILGQTSSVGPPSPNFYIKFSVNIIYRLRPVGPPLPAGPRPMAYVAYWEIRPCVRVLFFEVFIFYPILISKFYIIHGFFGHKLLSVQNLITFLSHLHYITFRKGIHILLR